MTDDELDRALDALSLEVAPADLHDRILSATILQQPATFRAWELWVLGTVLAVVAWLTYALLSSTPDAGSRIMDAALGFLRACGLTSAWTYLWLAIGASSAGLISRLTFMTPQRQTAYNR
jgi:hypothetical protein